MPDLSGVPPFSPIRLAAGVADQPPSHARDGLAALRAAVLNEVAAAGGLPDPDAPAQAAAEGARRLLGGRAALALLAHPSARPRIAAPQMLPSPLRRLAQRLPARLLTQAAACIETLDPAPAQVWPATGRRLALLLEQLGCAAVATVPVRGPDGPLALLVVGLERAEPPGPEREEALEALAQQAAAAISRAQDGAARRLQALRLELVAHISQALSATPDPLEAARRSVDLVRSLTPFGLLLLVTLDDARRRMRVTPLHPGALPPLLPSSLPADPDDSAAGPDQPVWVDLRRRSTELDAALWDVGMRSGVRAPLQAHGRRVGMLLALQQRRARPTEADLTLLQDLARLLAPAIESQQLQERAADTQRELRHITSSLVIANQRLHDLTQQLETAAREQQEFSREAVLMLAAAAEAKDQITGDHLRRIQHLSVALARRLRLPTGYVAELGYASMLHDVGKLHVPDDILRKPGPLTADEWDVIRQHPAAGVRILGSHPAFALAREICLAHHERWDGGGYPHGLSGEDIPLPARLVSVCDVFDSLVSVRSYKRAWTPQEALAYILEQSRRHFDPAIVAALLDLWDSGDIPRLLAPAAPEPQPEPEPQRAASKRTPPLASERAHELSRRWSGVAERVTRTLGTDSAIVCFERARERIEARHALSELFESSGPEPAPRLRLERLGARPLVYAEAAVQEYLRELHAVLVDLVGEPVASVLLAPPDPDRGSGRS